MPDENTPPESGASAPHVESADLAPSDAVTPSGYAYEVVADEAGSRAEAVPASVEKSSGGIPVWALIAAIVLPALAVGAVAWFLFSGGGSGDDRLHASTTSLLNAFTSGNGETQTVRFEGRVPPGYPEDIPSYGSSNVSGSVLQISGEDAGYIVVADTGDERDTVAAAFKEKFSADPWQIDGVQDGRDSTLYQFSRIDDANTTGIVLLGASKDGSRTTIITSVQEVSGAADREPDEFVPTGARSTPEGFPNEIPVYKGALLLESAFKNDAGSKSFRVSYIVMGDADDILKFYREGLESKELTVEDGDTSASTLENAQAIRFSDADLKLNGDVTVGTFGEDDGYIRIDVQAGDER